MAPFIVAALIAAGLFGTGTVIEPQQPALGTALQGAAIGTVIGGGIGAAAGVGSGLATGLGVTTTAGVVGGTAAIGGGLGAAGGWLVQKKDPVLVAPYETVLQNDVTVLKQDVANLKAAKRHKKLATQ